MNQEQREQIIKYVKDNEKYLQNNHETYDIFRGNLLPYVKDVLQSTLSDNYFQKIKSRIIPINILERYIKKVSVAYETPPKREANSPSGQIVLDYYVRAFRLNEKMHIADQYSHLFKGFALEPFFDEIPKLRVLPFDRFLVQSDNKVDPTKEDTFIKIMGKVRVNNREQNLYYVFTDGEVDAFTDDGETYAPALENNQGVNPYGVIHFTYGNRAENELLPIQDTDILSMAKLPSVFLSDLSGAILFSCFSIIYGIDLDMENATMSPNALWSFKSDKDSDKKPEIGTIKPEADIDQVMRFIVSTFVLWLETKGIRVGSVGNIDAGNAASGISKIIDEMDVYKVVKESITFFKNDEAEFWKKMIKVHNNWLATGEVSGLPRLQDDFEVLVEFPEPQPKRAKKDIIEEKKLEVEAGFKSRKKAIMELNPDMSEEEIELEIQEIDSENTEVVNDIDPVSDNGETDSGVKGNDKKAPGRNSKVEK